MNYLIEGFNLLLQDCSSVKLCRSDSPRYLEGGRVALGSGEFILY
jgi:hypothetical protein